MFGKSSPGFCLHLYIDPVFQGAQLELNPLESNVHQRANSGSSCTVCYFLFVNEVKRSSQVKVSVLSFIFLFKPTK